MSEPQKQGCRECGEIVFHRYVCKFSSTDVQPPTPVLDSERIQTDRVCPECESATLVQSETCTNEFHRVPDQPVAPDSAEVRHLLQCLAEECAEVIQACSKALRFGLDDDHQSANPDIVSPRLYIRKELNDVHAVVDMLFQLNVWSDVWLDDLQAAKVEKLTKMMDYAREKGML